MSDDALDRLRKALAGSYSIKILGLMSWRFNALLLVPLGLCSAAEAHAQTLASLTDADVAHGKRLYEGRCARCHGIQGGGGEGPALARPFLTYARDDATLVSVIQNGIPNTAMLANRVTDLEARQIAGYVRSLGRIAAEAPPSGDAVAGARLFREKGGCVVCHGVNGIGTQFGPRLREVGVRRNAAFIRESILDPGAALPQDSRFYPPGFREYLPVEAVQRPGDRAVRGYRVNESTFVILVRDESGRIHSFDKTELNQLVKQFGRSLMPSYREMFSDREVDDLIAYLIGLREPLP